MCVCRFANVNIWTVLKRGSRSGTTFIALYTEYQWDIIRQHWTRRCTVITERAGLTNTRRLCTSASAAALQILGDGAHQHIYTQKVCQMAPYKYHLQIFCSLKFVFLLIFTQVPFCSVECWIQFDKCLNWYERSKIS